jgi:hypothetical protein
LIPISESTYTLVLDTVQNKPLLTGPAVALAEHCLNNLPKKYPGLKLISFTIEPHRLEMVLDLQRLDEDLARIVQSFKSEMKVLLRKQGLGSDNFWQWSFKEIEAGKTILDENP